MVAATLCGITDPAKSSAASAPWATSGCGTRKWGGLPSAGLPLRSSIRSSPASATKSAANTSPPTTSPAISRPNGPQSWASSPASPSPSAPSTRTGTPSAPAAAKATSSTSSAPPPASSPWPRRPSSSPASAASCPAACIPHYTGIEAGLSATGDIFEAIARRAGTNVRELAQGLEHYRAGQTGLLRLSWDNGDRTVLVNPELGGVTLGWNLLHTAQDELFAAIEGTAFHTRIILERMAEHGVPIDRVINAGGIPQNNAVLNQIYANVLNKPVLVPDGTPTSLGSGIFALLAAGAFKSVEEAQQAVCLRYRTVLAQSDCGRSLRPALPALPQGILRPRPA